MKYRRSQELQRSLSHGKVCAPEQMGRVSCDSVKTCENELHFAWGSYVNKHAKEACGMLGDPD